MNLLVLTDPFGQPSYGPRVRYFCDYLTRHGHHVEVVTERFQPIIFDHTYPITEIDIYLGKWDWAIKSAWSLLTDWKNRYFSRKVRQYAVGKTYDLVFCTTFSTFPLRAALEVAKEKNLPLLVDIRDLDEQVPNAQYQSHRNWWARPFRKWYRAVNIRRRNVVLRQANAITTVSPWHVDFLKQFHHNVHLIYNGYDPEQFYFEGKRSERFLVSYIGKIYEFQHPDSLFQLLRSMPGVELNLHTPTENPIAITEVGEEIRRSSIMIVLTDPSAKGMMTTKFYEALGCEKPILCYPSDNGTLADVIEQTHAGIASGDSEEILRFVAEKQNEWKKNGFTHQQVENKDFFSREKQAHQLEDIMRQL